ncbi:type VI secretion system-associated FHA domain protein TagH [Paracoccus sp. ME4]|uniref:type VI secretion system-associated FHA domain protein TagH n=1 Tax=Paracoccus sp. ME4 TaxID=3138066 RepID=UPI00398B04F4
MSLTLRIENFHVLDDGGPVSIQVPETGLQAGRRSGMDWVLPDASRFISGHHFSVAFDGTTWWLRDVSMNGTFLQDHRHRLDGAHRLSHGDRFQVGHYLIVALFDAVQGAGPILPASLPGHRLDRVVEETPQDDPWAIGGPSVAPVDPMPSESRARLPDFGDDFIALDQAAPVPPAPPAPAPVPSAPAVPVAADPAAAPAFLRAFCEGAGLDPALATGVDPALLGRQLGETMRLGAGQIMAALRDRSTARHFTRAGERTMRGATENNPLKFLPDAEQAIEALYLRPRAGFLTGAAGFDEALSDLRRHQAAIFAALQPALLELTADLEPSGIEAEARGGLAGGRKAKAWDTYVARWDAKAASENGILDAFIRLFAQEYRKMDGAGDR